MDPIAITWILERVNWLIGRFSEREDRKIEERAEAINALLKALGETRILFGTLRASRQRDRLREEKVSRLWIKAARKSEPFDSDLSERCLIKGRYWADPIGWSNEEIANARISIEEVENSLKELKRQRFR